MMRMVGTKVHGLLDYLMGIGLIAAPLLLNLATDGVESWVPAVLGGEDIHTSRAPAVVAI